MFDHTITDAIRFTGEPDLAAACLNLTTRHGGMTRTINARCFDDDDRQTLVSMLYSPQVGCARTDAQTRADRFIEAAGRGAWREAVAALGNLIDIHLALDIDLREQAGRWPVILWQSTIDTDDVREQLATYDPPITPNDARYSTTCAAIRDNNESDWVIQDQLNLIDTAATQGE